MDDVLDRISESSEAYAPQIIGALVILAIGWLIAWGASRIVRAVLHRTNIDNRIAGWLSQDGEAHENGAVERGISSGVFWIIILLTVISALETLELETVTEPLNAVVEDILGFLPNLIAALLLLAVGWFVAVILRRMVENIVRAFGIDSAGERAGIGADTQAPRLSEVIGLVVFAIILIPAIVASLNALEIDAVAGPTSEMLEEMLSIVPNLFAAAVLLLIAFIVARIVSQIVATVFAGLGFNTLPERLGATPGQATAAGTTPSQLVGYLLLVGIMFIASMEALRVIGFVLLAELIREFLVFSGQVLMGVIIIGIGLFFATLAARTIRTSGTANGNLLATIARVAIIAFALAVGLRQMGIANEIIILAFALPLGALSIAAAIALGLGGREVAARELENARQRARGQAGGGTP